MCERDGQRGGQQKKNNREEHTFSGGGEGAEEFFYGQAESRGGWGFYEAGKKEQREREREAVCVRVGERKKNMGAGLCVRA